MSQQRDQPVRVRVHAAHGSPSSFVTPTIASGGTSALRLTLTNPAANAAAVAGLSVTDRSARST